MDHLARPNLKSDNLQYNTLACWVDGTNDSSTKLLMFQVFFHNFFIDLSLVLLLINFLTNELRLHQFLLTKTTEANKSLITDANGAH